MVWSFPNSTSMHIHILKYLEILQKYSELLLKYPKILHKYLENIIRTALNFQYCTDWW